VFSDCILNNLVVEIEKRREEINKPFQRALLIVDGHTSRLQLELWKIVASKNIDVLVIPSHTSQHTQPLDLSVNGCFKYNLQLIDGLPSKKKIPIQLNKFIGRLIDTIYISLKPSTIRKGFYNSHLLNSEHDIAKLKQEIDSHLQTLPLSSHLGVFYIFFYFKFIF
jgi:hypothetical protein